MKNSRFPSSASSAFTEQEVLNARRYLRTWNYTGESSTINMDERRDGGQKNLIAEHLGL